MHCCEHMTSQLRNWLMQAFVECLQMVFGCASLRELGMRGRIFEPYYEQSIARRHGPSSRACRFKACPLLACNFNEFPDFFVSGWNVQHPYAFPTHLSNDTERSWTNRQESVKSTASLGMTVPVRVTGIDQEKNQVLVTMSLGSVYASCKGLVWSAFRWFGDEILEKSWETCPKVLENAAKPNLSQSPMTGTRTALLHSKICIRSGVCNGGSATVGQPPAHLGWILKKQQNHEQKKRQNINRTKEQNELFEFYPT